MIIDGLAGFSVRKQGVNPIAQPYEKVSSNTNVFKIGTPLVKSATSQLVDLPPITTGASTAAKIIGFAAAPDRLADTAEFAGTNSGFARFPGQNAANGNERVIVELADPTTIFTGNLTAGIVAAITLIGTAVGLKQDATTLQWTIDNSVATKPFFIVGIPDSQIGVSGGLVDFIVPAAASQWLNGN